MGLHALWCVAAPFLLIYGERGGFGSSVVELPKHICNPAWSSTLSRDKLCRVEGPGCRWDRIGGNGSLLGVGRKLAAGRERYVDNSYWGENRLAGREPSDRLWPPSSTPDPPCRAPLASLDPGAGGHSYNERRMDRAWALGMLRNEIAGRSVGESKRSKRVRRRPMGR